MSTPFEPVTFASGATMANRFMLAPLTNQQSHADGTISDDEFQWLVARAEGGFGLTMTCAAHVAARGQGFPGQLGCFSDAHLSGLTRLADAIHAHGSLAVVQLHHAGRRAPSELINAQPLAPFDDESTGARAMTTDEVRELIEEFVAAAERCQRAGFDGVELHGAHDYVLCEFLNAERNHRDDGYGGSFEDRTRIFDEILEGVRRRCGAAFLVAVRLSPERFGMRTSEIVTLFERFCRDDRVDMIDLSLWDTFKTAVDPEFEGQELLSLFTKQDRGATVLAVAGQLYGGGDVHRALAAGVDVVALGRAAIVNHDFPRLMAQSPEVVMRALPVSAATLAHERVGAPFVTYLRNWPGFVAP